MSETDWGLLNTDFTGQQKAAFNYADQVRQSAAQYQAGAKYAQGDYAGAAQTQALAGNIPAARETQQYAQKTAADANAYIAKSVQTFAAIAKAHANDTDGGASAIGQQFDTIANEVKSVTGATDQQLMGLRQSLVSNTAATLSRLNDSLPVEYKTSGDTLLQFRGNQLANSWTGGKQVVVGNKVVQIPFSQNPAPGSGTPTSSGSAAPAAPAADTAPPAAFSPNLISGIDTGAMHAVESGGNPGAVSPKGAQGVAQVMPATAADPGFGVAPAKDNSPGELQRVGDQTLAAYTQHYGNAALGHIAYNWGPGNTDKWLAAGGDFAKLPPETQTYLGRIAVAQAVPQRGSGQQPAPQQQQQGQPSTSGQSGGAQVVFDGGQQWRQPTAAESKQYPGIVQVNSSTGAVKYAPAGITSVMSPAAVQLGAAYFVQNGGKFPGTARDRQSQAAILDLVAQHKPAGMSDDDWTRVIQNNGLSLHGRQAAVGSAARGQVGTAINEGTVNNSINILRNLIPVAASQGSFTSLNSLSQYIGRQMNDGTAANFKNAVDSITAEYARVMTGATTGAPSSDASRHSAEERILLGYNKKTLPAVLNQMQQEMRGRSNAYAGALNSITGGGYAGVPVQGESDPPAQSNNGQGRVVDFNSLRK